MFTSVRCCLSVTEVIIFLRRDPPVTCQATNIFKMYKEKRRSTDYPVLRKDRIYGANTESLQAKALRNKSVAAKWRTPGRQALRRLRSEQRLSVLEQSNIYGIYVISFSLYKILNDQILLTAGRESKTRPRKEILGIIKV